MIMKGSTVMFIGCWLLLIIVIYTPHEHLLSVAIPFMIIEVIIAVSFIIINKRRIENEKRKGSDI